MKIKALFIAILACSTTFAFGQQGDEFKPGGKLFGLLFTNFHTSFSDGHGHSAFEIGRSYLGYDYNFSREISSRVMYDGTTQVINGKTIYSGYLRNAYLQYSNGQLLVRGGLIGIEQISFMESMWGYRFVTKPPIDYSGMIEVADLGIMGKVKAGQLLEFDLSLTNGRGVKDLASDGTMRLTAGVTLFPADNITVRGYYDMMGPSGRMQRTASLLAAWHGEPLSFGAEYFRQDNSSMIAHRTYSGISLFTRVPVAEKLRIFARYDNIISERVSPSGERWNLARDGSYLFAGLDYSPVKNVRLAPNLSTYLPASQSRANILTVGLNVEAKF